MVFADFFCRLQIADGFFRSSHIRERIFGDFKSKGIFDQTVAFFQINVVIVNPHISPPYDNDRIRNVGIAYDGMKLRLPQIPGDSAGPFHFHFSGNALFDEFDNLLRGCFAGKFLKNAYRGQPVEF